MAPNRREHIPLQRVYKEHLVAHIQLFPFILVLYYSVFDEIVHLLVSSGTSFSGFI